MCVLNMASLYFTISSCLRSIYSIRFLIFILSFCHYFFFSFLHDNVSGETEPVGESPMEVLSTPRAIQEIMRINDTLKSARNFNSSIGGGGGSGGGLDFLGCMPINLSRRNLLNVQRY